MQGAPAPPVYGFSRNGNDWWLRSPGDSSEYASGVTSNGDVGVYGSSVNSNYKAVRPALHLNLSSALGWSYAGTVTSDGGGEEIEASNPIVSSSPTESGNTQKPQETVEPGKTAGPEVTEKPSLPPSPTESGNTQKPQGTVEPGEIAGSEVTEKPSLSPSPTEPENTQKPQETEGPEGTLQSSTTEKPSVTPTIPGKTAVPSASVTPSPNTLSDPGKGMIGKVLALKLKQKNHTVTVSWKKLTGVKGYQICYSTTKKWRSKKQKMVTKNNAIIKNLKKKKTYYFRVRAYRLEGTKKVYGAWSATKRITIKM